MRKAAWCGIILAALTVAGPARAQQPAAMQVRAPELSGATTWLNSRPLSMSRLRGHVVALHFWTFG